MFYNRAYRDLPVDQINTYFKEQFNLKSFKFLMDHIRFEFLIEGDDRLIIDNIKELISYKNIDEECNPDIEPDECVEGYSCQSASQDPEVELYTCQIEY